MGVFSFPLRSQRGCGSLLLAVLFIGFLLVLFQLYTVPTGTSIPQRLGITPQPVDHSAEHAALDREKAKQAAIAKANAASAATLHDGPYATNSPSVNPVATELPNGEISKVFPVASSTHSTHSVALYPEQASASSAAAAAAASQAQPVEPKLDVEGSGLVDDNVKNIHNLTTTLVVGRLDADVEGVKWIHDELRDITHKAIYIVDDPRAPLHLDKNKGREAMVYVKYILEHYDKLDDVTLFFHSSRMAWHNNVLFKKDAAIMINNMRRQWVVEKGYVPGRCELYPGCEKWIKFNPRKDEVAWHPDRNMDLFSLKLWDQLFPNRTGDPDYLSEPCCSQFAASRDAIRSVPLEQWQRVHDWLFSTGTLDGYTGRVMEYMWQYLFLGKDEHCPDMRECYCQAYGVCMADDTELLEYNFLRWETDDLLTKLGLWDMSHDCGNKKTKQDKARCKSKNPNNPLLAQNRKRKNELETLLPEKYGIMTP